MVPWAMFASAAISDIRLAGNPYSAKTLDAASTICRRLTSGWRYRPESPVLTRYVSRLGDAVVIPFPPIPYSVTDASLSR